MKNNYRLGVASVSFRGYSPNEILKQAKKAGLSCIEWGSDVHAPCTNLEKINEIATLQKEYGIECSSYGTYFWLGETKIDELEQYIAAAKALGTNVLRIWGGRKCGANMTSEEKNNFLSLCREVAAIAKENNVLVCLECHKDTFTEQLEDAVWLINSINSLNFSMYWQPFHWQSEQQNIENAKKVAAHSKHIHVFNWKGKEKFPLCDATKEWQNYLKKFSTPRTLLLEFMPNGSLDELLSETLALKTIIGEM